MRESDKRIRGVKRNTVFRKFRFPLAYFASKLSLAIVIFAIVVKSNEINHHEEIICDFTLDKHGKIHDASVIFVADANGTRKKRKKRKENE